MIQILDLTCLFQALRQYWILWRLKVLERKRRGKTILGPGKYVIRE